MTQLIHTLRLDLDFKLLQKLSRIDRFDAAWSAIEKKEARQTLKQLKNVATVQSVAASTRIEGSRLSNDEVKVLIADALKIEKLEDRDQQEVLGYHAALDLISDAWREIAVTENNLKHLHGVLMKYSEKDQWHKADYKKHSNSVEALNANGSRTVLFDTAAPGFETEDAMRALIEWYERDEETLAVIKTALFVYEFLSIHPFQDGNGRLSRLLATLLLLQHGYAWIEYVSFENEIEERKSEYYRALMDCQQQRPGENAGAWLMFFLDCMVSIQEKLQQKLKASGRESSMSSREKMIYSYIDNHPGCSSGEIARKLELPLPSVKRILAEMVNAKLIGKHGRGIGTHYSTEANKQIQQNMLMEFNEEYQRHNIVLKNKHSWLELKKVILDPKSPWRVADDWSIPFLKSGLTLKVHGDTANGNAFDLPPLYLAAFNDPMNWQPELKLRSGIQISGELMERKLRENEYPIALSLQIEGDLSQFDLKLIYDGVLD